MKEAATVKSLALRDPELREMNRQTYRAGSRYVIWAVPRL